MEKMNPVKPLAPYLPERLAGLEGLADNLRLQDRVAQLLKALRHEHGALDLQTLEARPVFAGDKIQDLQADERNRAKEIIEDFMIAANGVTARFLHGRGRQRDMGPHLSAPDRGPAALWG